MGQSLVAPYARISERRVFITAEGEHGLVHMLSVEHLELHKQVEILHRQTSHGLKQVGFNLGNDILQRVLPEIGQIHECRDVRGELPS